MQVYRQDEAKLLLNMDPSTISVLTLYLFFLLFFTSRRSGRDGQTSVVKENFDNGFQLPFWLYLLF